MLLPVAVYEVSSIRLAHVPEQALEHDSDAALHCAGGRSRAAKNLEPDPVRYPYNGSYTSLRSNWEKKLQHEKNSNPWLAGNFQF